MYVKYTDFTGSLPEGDVLLMSHEDFTNGGSEVTGVPVTITPDGNEPVILEDE